MTDVHDYDIIAVFAGAKHRLEVVRSAFPFLPTSWGTHSRNGKRALRKDFFSAAGATGNAYVSAD